MIAGSTRLKQLEASIKCLQDGILHKSPQYKAIYRKNLHYVMQEYNDLKGKK